MVLTGLFGVALGILSVAALFSLAASALKEIIADQIGALRGRTLAEGLRTLIESKYADDVFARLAREGDDAVAAAAGLGAKAAIAAQRALDEAVAAGDEAAAAEARAARSAAFGERGARKAAEWALSRFYDHPDIRALTRDSPITGRRKPSAIEPRRYAETLVAILENRDALEASAQRALEAKRADLSTAMRETADALGLDRTGAVFAEETEAMFARAAESLGVMKTAADLAIERLETEFDEAMARVSGWYGRKTRSALFFIGLALAIGSNVDMLRYSERLMTQGDLRARAEAYAAIASQTPGEGGARAVADGLFDELGALGVEIGWRCEPVRNGARIVAIPAICGSGAGFAAPGFARIVGWLLIAAGVTLGASFWYGAIRKLVGWRAGAGKLATRADET